MGDCSEKMAVSSIALDKSHSAYDGTLFKTPMVAKLCAGITNPCWTFRWNLEHKQIP